MHEGGAVARALDPVMRGVLRASASRHLELEIHDGTRAEKGAVAFYVAAILADHGLGDVTFSVRERPIECALCGCLASPTPSDPTCDQCGAPLSRRDGPAVTCREVALEPLSG